MIRGSWANVQWLAGAGSDFGNEGRKCRRGLARRRPNSGLLALATSSSSLPARRLPSPSAASVDAPSLVTDKHQNDRSVLALTAGAVFGGGEPRCLSPILYLSFNLLIYYMY